MITRRRKLTVARPTTLVELLPPGTQNFCEIVTYFVCDMQDGIVYFRRKLFPFGLVSPECEDPVGQNAQINGHSGVFDSQVVAGPPPIAMQESDNEGEDRPYHQSVANRHHLRAPVKAQPLGHEEHQGEHPADDQTSKQISTNLPDPG